MESQVLSVSNGIFNVQLGAVSPIPAAAYSKSVLYLGIQVGADAEMTPRQRVSANPIGYYVPIGSVVAWSKSTPGTPPLSDEWVECNGQVLVDPESPYNGQTIPDLNGQGRLLQGALASGGIRTEDYLPAHTHGAGSLKFQSNAASAQPLYAGSACGGNVCGGQTASTESGTPLTAFQVVWIMRIK